MRQLLDLPLQSDDAVFYLQIDLAVNQFFVAVGLFQDNWSPFQPIRCLRFETGFQSQFYNLEVLFSL
jgi:hypothetical protein